MCVCINIEICTYKFMYTNCMDICIYICICICVCECMCVCEPWMAAVISVNKYLFYTWINGSIQYDIVVLSLLYLYVCVHEWNNDICITQKYACVCKHIHLSLFKYGQSLVQFELHPLRRRYFAFWREKNIIRFFALFIGK